MRDATEVAKRCLCLELLHQRLGLEPDGEDVRKAWLSNLERFALSSEEKALFEKPVGSLTEEDLDELHGRATGALVFLWALGRLPLRPSTDDDLDELLAAHGLLGDGSISEAFSKAEAATLRSDSELRDGEAAYAKRRGKSREADDREKIVAELALHHLEWIMVEEMAFED